MAQDNNSKVEVLKKRLRVRMVSGEAITACDRRSNEKLRFKPITDGNIEALAEKWAERIGTGH
jgi:hypothetical protein